MSESIQHKLDRVRPPRVQITYDVEIGDAIVQKELPFVAGVLGNFSGNDYSDLPAYKKRRFVDIDRDNFDDVLNKQMPKCAFQVDNKLQEGKDGLLSVALQFEKMSDFQPYQLAKKVAPLNDLLEVRDKLTNLLVKLEGNDSLNKLLSTVATDNKKLTELKKLLVQK